MTKCTRQKWMKMMAKQDEINIQIEKYISLIVF